MKAAKQVFSDWQWMAPTPASGWSWSSPPLPRNRPCSPWRVDHVWLWRDSQISFVPPDRLVLRFDQLSTDSKGSRNPFYGYRNLSENDQLVTSQKGFVGFSLLIFAVRDRKENEQKLGEAPRLFFERFPWTGQNTDHRWNYIAFVRIKNWRFSSILEIG